MQIATDKRRLKAFWWVIRASFIDVGQAAVLRSTSEARKIMWGDDVGWGEEEH